MATIRYVKPEHVDLIRDLIRDHLNSDDGAVVLVFPDAQKHAKLRGFSDGQSVNYNFGGGDPDLRIELVRSEEHYFFSLPALHDM